MTDSEKTRRDAEFLLRAKAHAQRKRRIPADMGFQPLSDKFMEGSPVKASWLRDYLHYRQQHCGASRACLLRFLAEAGADHSALADRSRGSLLGLAIGDAIGTTLEFRKRDEVFVSDMVGGGPFSLPAGYWTDDTSMACCLAYSLIKCQGFDPKHVMQSFAKWYLYGAYSPTGACFDIGGITRAAIDRFLRTGDVFAGSTDPDSAGNGSLMCLAPVPIYYADDFAGAVDKAAESSRVTHGAIEAVDACRYFAALIHGALRGEPKERLLAPLYSPEPGYWTSFPLAEKIEAIARGSYKNKARLEIKSSGYVVDTLEAALWALYRSEDFRSGLLDAVNLAGDADTVGAVYGQLAGALYGETRVPIAWIQKLYGMQGFYHFAMDLRNRRSSPHQRR
jgi:ADP-ribosyl-[dinitrogen reductase] hydrolase